MVRSILAGTVSGDSSFIFGLVGDPDGQVSAVTLGRDLFGDSSELRLVICLPGLSGEQIIPLPFLSSFRNIFWPAR